MRSGLPSFALRANDLNPLTIFNRKTLRGILGLSKSSNVSSLYFLLGKLPIEGQLHRDIFALFYNVWSNPDSKVYSIVKYLLENSPENGRTWSNHIRSLSRKYNIEDPLQCLKRDPPKKSLYKGQIITKICKFHESSLKKLAKENSRMQFFNVSLFVLRGCFYPALHNIQSTFDVIKSRLHL